MVVFFVPTPEGVQRHDACGVDRLVLLIFEILVLVLVTPSPDFFKASFPVLFQRDVVERSIVWLILNWFLIYIMYRIKSCPKLYQQIQIVPANNIHTTIKVYARCLRPDIEYKTLSITFQTTCREVVATLLGKYKMKHRDPKLFYLSMEVTVRKAGVRTHLALDDEARPAVLQSCHPRGDSKFSLQTRRGGLVKVYDSALNSNSQYKSLLISAQTTADEVISLLLTCCNSKERVEQFSIYEVCTDKEQQRKLHPDDRPLQVQQTWLPSLSCHFLVRRNPEYHLPLSRRKIFWIPELTPQSKRPPLAYRSQLLSKSQSSLPTSRNQEEKNNSTKIKELPSSSPLACIKSIPETSTKQISSSSDKPSYADYENYFYI